MPEDTVNKEEETKTIDLSELQSLDFGPAWSEQSTKRFEKRIGNRQDTRRGKSGGSPGSFDNKRRTRPQRPAGANRSGQSGNNANTGSQHSRGPRDRRETAQSFDTFKPLFDVQIFPDDIAFKALCHAMRSNGITYELFEIARLILAKPERFIANVKPLVDEKDAPQQFYCSIPEGIPFVSEDELLSYVMAKQLDQFVETEEKTVEPPSGNFQSINRCGFTGELLGPPNYHRYQELLKEHHATRVAHIHFERFVAKVESIREPEQIEAWLEKMKTVTHYRVKDTQEGEPETIETLEALKSFLLIKRRDKIMRVQSHARIAGRNIAQLAKDSLRRSVEATIEKQLHFPLDSANNIRGRLRRMRFTIYKKGSKNISYVCAIKRKFRSVGVKFSDSLQGLIEFIEGKPNIKVAQLPKQYLGIATEDLIKPKPKKDASAPAIDEVPKEQAQKIVEKHEIERAKKLAEKKAETAASDAIEAETTEKIKEVVSPISEDSAEEVAAPEPKIEVTSEATQQPIEESKTSDEAVAPEAQASTVPAVAATEQTIPEVAATQTTPEPAPASEPESKEELAVKKMMMDLRWLVSEGYVVEFGSGALTAVPVAVDPVKTKEPKAGGTANKQAAKASADKTMNDSAKVTTNTEPTAQAEATPPVVPAEAVTEEAPVAVEDPAPTSESGPELIASTTTTEQPEQPEKPAE